MHPILFQLGSVVFYTHGVVTVAGIILGAWLSYALFRRQGLATEYFADNVVIAALAGVIGARIAYFAIYREQFTSFWQFFEIWNGGLISYGGFVVGLAAFVLLLRGQRRPIWQSLDLLAIGMFLGLAVGRIGEIFAGEYAGVYSASFVLTLGHLVTVVLIPFWEAVLCLALVVFGVTMAAKGLSGSRPGLIFLSSFLAYTIGRFIIDTGRYERYSYHTITLGQIVGLALFVIILIILFIRKRSEYGTR